MKHYQSKTLRIYLTLITVITTVIFSFSQTLKDAIKMTDNERFESAAEVFKKLLQAEPKNGDYYFYYGENYFKDEGLNNAMNIYKKGTELIPSNPLNYVGLGKVQWYANNSTDANSNFYKAMTLSQSKNATVLMKIAEAYIKAENKNLTEAIKLLNQAMQLEPKNPEVYILMGDALLEQSPQNGSQAITNYEKATDLDKTSVKAILRIGQLYGKARNYTLALEYYQKAIDTDSTFAPAYREKAEIYFKAQKFDLAISNYRKYLTLNDNLSARNRYGSFLFVNKNYKDAITEIGEIQKEDTNNIYFYRILAYSYYETGDYANGLINSNKFFEKAGTEFKLLASDYEYYGKLLSKTGNDSLAIIQLNKAMQIDTTKTELYGEIGAVFYKMRKYPEAIENYEKKIAAGKGVNANDYFGIGRAAYYSLNFGKADTAFAQITVSNPDLPLGYIWRAKANVQLDPKNETWLAKPYYEQFIEKVKPEETEQYKKDLIQAYEYLGYHYVITKDFALAKTYFGKLKELDPNNEKQKGFFNSPEGK